jgi:hypothetical protein
MAIGTDKELLKRTKKRIKPAKKSRGGRPMVNRELVIRLLKSVDSQGNPRYSYAQIGRDCGCSSRTVRDIRDEALASGELVSEERKKTALNMIEADFESECVRAKGVSFYQWLKDSTPTAYTTIFNFTEMCWSEIWDKCSLVDVRDQDNQLGDQICQKWLAVFNEDKKRIRRRKKQIRYIFRFLGREDLCLMYLRMRKGQDPLEIRKVPEISFMSYPEKLEECMSYMEKIFPKSEDTLSGREVIMIKLVTQCRTGDQKAERDLWGLRMGTDSICKSYLLMDNVDEYRMNLFSKGGADWEMIWIPKQVREILWRIYQRRDYGDLLMKGVSLNKFRKHWNLITTEVFGRPIKLHDLRKTSITWLFANGISLEICTHMNEGWEDMNTATKHYLEVRKFLRGSVREEYNSKIPDWFKEGLEDFRKEEAIDRIKV